jgi:HAD superfamily hydrolase (TIGR01509 family)
MSANLVHASNKGVIFDVDGVLVDSYRSHFRSWQIAAAEQGLEITESQFRETFGRKSHETILDRWGDRLGDSQVEAFERRKEAAYRELVAQDFPLMDGAAELLKALAAAGFALAIASSGPPENIHLLLDHLPAGDAFSAIVTGADVTRGKPDPQVFVIAAERLGLPPRRCAVIEDSPPGIAAAKAAGALAIGLVSTGHTPESLAAADHRVDSLRELAPPRILQWLAEP